MGDGERAEALRIEVTPEPDEDEAAAVAAALAVLRAAGRRDEAADQPPRLSRWALAGRRAAMRGSADGLGIGWGRTGGDWGPRRM